MLDGLNLNGSNPIAVMTQDITRSFLAGSSDKSDRKKFDIYMEATLMAQSQENYQVLPVLFLAVLVYHCCFAFAVCPAALYGTLVADGMP